jgi:hypothetical protein
MGGIGNVVVNTLVRMFTKKAVGKAMKSAGSMGRKKSKPAGPRKKGNAKGNAKGKKVAG